MGFRRSLVRIQSPRPVSPVGTRSSDRAFSTSGGRFSKLLSKNPWRPCQGASPLDPVAGFEKGEFAMGRPRKPYFRESDGWWVSRFHGEYVKLARGRENEPQAVKRFHELMALEAVSTPLDSAEATTASLCETFLAWSHR